MEETIAALRAENLKSSVDLQNLAELERAVRAGADHLLSLDEQSEHFADHPNLFPSLFRRRMDIWICRNAPPKRRARAASTSFSIEYSILSTLGSRNYLALCGDAPARAQRGDHDGNGQPNGAHRRGFSGVTAMLLGLCSELNIGILLRYRSAHILAAPYRSMMRPDA